MLGRIWFRTKVLRCLSDNFNYKPAVPGSQEKVFNEMTAEALKHKLNEYDAAVMFMLVQINVLSVCPHTVDFVKTHLANVSAVMQMCESPVQDIRALADEVAARHGITQT